MIAKSSSDRPSPPPSRWKVWRRWSILLLFAVVEGSVAGAARDGIAGAIKGGLFGALVGPPLLAIASIVGNNPRHYLRALLFAAVAEAVGVLMLGAMAGFIAGIPAWLLAGQVIVPFAIIPTVGRVLSRERRWVTRGAVIGAALGSITGIGLGIYIGINEGEPPLVTAIIAGACGFVLALIGVLIGAFVFSCVSATWRSIHRRRITSECRRARRSREAAGNSTHYLSLSDLDRIAALPPVYRDFCLLLLTALSTRARTLQFESLGNISRVQLKGKDSTEELAPLPVSTDVLVRWVLGDAVVGAAASEETDSRRLRMEIGEGEFSVVVFTEGSRHRRRLGFHFPESEPFSEEAAALLRDYRRFFVGDPWTLDQPVRLPLRQTAEANGLPNGTTAYQPHKEGESLLRLSYRSQFILGGDSPVWAAVDGVRVANGSVRNGFDRVLPISTGNHLLGFALEASPSAPGPPPWLGPKDSMRTVGPQLLLSIPGPGDYRVRLCRVHFSAGQYGGYVPVLRQLSAAERENYFSKTE
jgi:hypothetical protein